MSVLPSTRLRIRVRGLVQGVGFRPFVYRLAVEQGLSGWVRNDEQGVVMEVQGAGASAMGDVPSARPNPESVGRVQ